MDPAFGALRGAIDTLASAADAFEAARDARLAEGPPPNAPAVNDALLSLEQAFQYTDGLQFGDQFRSLYASPNPFNGYASWMLPGLRHPVVTDASDEALAKWTRVYRGALQSLTDRVRAATTALRESAPAGE
jgi:N-acetylated-alpha-linked acidic dipeptidase